MEKAAIILAFAAGK